VPRTRILKVDPEHPDSAALEQAAEYIRAGKLVAFPTETVYGLGANALDPSAVSAIFRAKGRPPTDPLIVHIADFSQLREITREVPPAAESLAHHFWPGPLTFVLFKSALIPPQVTAGSEKVAVRWPSHPVAQALIRLSGVPIAAPSANLFGHISPTTAEHVYADLHGRVHLILDGGPTFIGLESTVLDLTTAPPRLLRPGGIPLEALRPFLGDVTLGLSYQSENAVAESPGQMLRHYAPQRATLLLFEGEGAPLLLTMQKVAQEYQQQGQRVGILSVDEEQQAFSLPDAEVISLGSRHDLEAIARNLFAALRKLEEKGVEVILARTFPREHLGLAIWDRLYRAAQGRIIRV
jgi:L-threonylcarbamoyladenylate synthase